MPTSRLVSLLLPSVLLLSMSACIGGRTPPSEFYLLEPIRGAEAGRQSLESGKPVIALAPLRIPQYVDRPQMVVATGRNAYKLSETNRWAERLDDNIARVLAQNLGWLIPADLVSANVSAIAKQAKLKLSVNILQFHVDPQGQAELAAQWHVARGEEIVVTRQGGYREPASTTDYSRMAQALNECLNRLSKDIADSIRRLGAEN